MYQPIAEHDPYDAFVFPDGCVMYRHEFDEEHPHGLAPNELEHRGIQVYPKGSAEWHHLVDDNK